MIGPHQGKELELMLAGGKALAVYSDAIPARGDIAEEIIPERTFAPHVQAGRIVRLAEDIPSRKDKTPIRYVCFALPDEIWRARFFLWLKREFNAGRISHSPEHDRLIGWLLGYTEDDIEDFIDHSKRF